MTIQLGDIVGKTHYLRQEKPKVFVIYDFFDRCIGNFEFEEYGYNRQGTNLRWADRKPPFDRHAIHFVGSTYESVMRVWELLVEQHIEHKQVEIKY